MKTSLALLLALACPAFAQDAVEANPRQNTVLVDNDRVRVYETRLAPGEAAPMHSHPPFVTYCLSDAQVKFTLPDGSTQERTLKQGMGGWHPPMTHSVLNSGTTEFRVLHVEVKDFPGASQSRFVQEANLEWIDAPASLPKGCKMTILHGHPSKPGPFSMRIKFPAGTVIPPHWHPADEHATVLSGILKIGKGKTFDESAATAVRSCGFSLMPAGTPHFGIFPEETVLQLHGIGPWKVIYLDETKNKPEAEKTGIR